MPPLGVIHSAPLALLPSVDARFHNLGRLLLLIGSLTASLSAQADPISALQVLREGGCGGTMPPARALRHVAALDRAAEHWAGGRSLAESTTGLHIKGPDSATMRLLKQSGCRTVTNPSFHDVGLYQRGADSWLVLGSVYVAPASAQAPLQATRVLQLINEVRAHGARCGERSFAPAPPVRLSQSLADVAFGHASDMATHGYFEHEDLAGHSPADRVRAVGTGKNSWARISPTAPNRPTKSCRAGSTAQDIVKTSWMLDSPKWGLRMRRAVRQARPVLGAIAGRAESVIPATRATPLSRRPAARAPLRRACRRDPSHPCRQTSGLPVSATRHAR